MSLIAPAYHLPCSHISRFSFEGEVASRSSQQQEADGGGSGIQGADILDTENYGKEDRDGDDSSDDGSEWESDSDSDWVESSAYHRKMVGGPNGVGGVGGGVGGNCGVDEDCATALVSLMRVTRYRKREQAGSERGGGAQSQQLLPSSVNTPIKGAFSPAEVRSAPCADGGSNYDNKTRLGSGQEPRQATIESIGVKTRNKRSPCKSKKTTPHAKNHHH